MATGLNKAHFEARSEFRHQLRRFERFGEEAAQDAGLTFAQYLLLLHVKGMPGRAWAVVGELAERLQLRHHTTVELVARCESAGLVRRRADPGDARKVRVGLSRIEPLPLAPVEDLRAAIPETLPGRPEPVPVPASAPRRASRSG